MADDFDDVNHQLEKLLRGLKIMKIKDVIEILKQEGTWVRWNRCTRDRILFGNEKQYGIDIENDTPMRSGYAVFNEFIAEYIAHVVSNGEGFEIYNPNMYLQLAFQEERTINPYWLSRYMAIIAGDSNVSDECVAAGADYVKPVVWNYVTEMFRMVDKQLKKDNFWKAESAFIENLGTLYDNMFSVVFRWL